MTRSSANRTKAMFSVVPSQKEIDREARLLWAKMAEASAPDFNSGFDESASLARIANSPLSSCLQTFPDDDPIRVLGFSLQVTENCVRHVLDEADEPSRLLFLASRLAEYGMYTFADPNDLCKKLRTHLTASKALGYFFTPPEIAYAMAKSVLADRRRVESLLDPAAGLGSLLGAVVLCADELGIEIGHIEGFEVDPFTARLADQVLGRLKTMTGGAWTHNIDRCDAIERLMIEVEEDASPYDAVILNPPYGRVKFLRSSLTNSETIAHLTSGDLKTHQARLSADSRQKAAHLKRLSAALGLGPGEQNLQRLFIAMSHRRLSEVGRMSVISPSSWLGDRDGEGLRRHLVDNRAIESIVVYPEDSGLFATVNQVTAVVNLSPPSSRTSIPMQIVGQPNGNGKYSVSYSRLGEIDPDRLRIPRLNRQRSAIFDRLQAQPQLANLPYVKNARGELDLTMFKNFISSDPHADRLVRGDHIERFVLRSSDFSKQPSYVDRASFIANGINGSKAEDIGKRRLACRQVSYLNKPRRLSFALVPEGTVLGNSCNYLVVSERPDEEDVLYALLALFNSVVVEWFFRIFNSNNHVANYEINEFPVWSDDADLRLLSQWGRYLEQIYASGVVDSRRAHSSEDFCDALACFLLGLSSEQAAQVVEDIDPDRSLRVGHLVGWLSEYGVTESLLEGVGWPQHLAPKLSEHDLEVTSHIPQGGNWQDIPEGIPSKRLDQIREMTIERGGAVRTSYYGRLRPDQPAYTIATYYNRPGNGTNIVPWVDRTLTTREAARLQSFPDWYMFVPSEAANRKHVGNAVPPLLAYAVGSHLIGSTQSKLAVDLFAGAGGLSLGLELAGWDVAVAIDNDKRALQTYALNRPSESAPDPKSQATLVLERDLSTEAERKRTLELIREKVGTNRIGLLAGGPPCQGFSTAGWRLKDDDRNDLAVVFMELVDDLKPECVVLENVEGLLNYRQGAVVRDLLGILQELGYRTDSSPWVLAAEQYGVPQMRRRVFLVGHRDPGFTAPPPTVLDRCLGRREFKRQTGFFDQEMTLRYPVTVAEAIGDLQRLGEITHESMGLRPVRQHYERWVKGELSTEQFLLGMVADVD